MKLKLLFAFLFLVSIQTFAQDKKWSAEANYTVVPVDGFFGDVNTIDLGLKYRVADFSFLNLGFSFNGGLSREKFASPSTIIRRNSYYFQPRIFSEFTIPGIEKLRPSIGLGYSIIYVDAPLDLDPSVITSVLPSSSKTTNGGFNLNLGISYDVTKRFFVQAQYDFINLKVKDDFIINEEVVKTDLTRKLNSIRIGVGFRF